jgi:hypothetical protein
MAAKILVMKVLVMCIPAILAAGIVLAWHGTAVRTAPRPAGPVVVQPVGPATTAFPGPGEVVYRRPGGHPSVTAQVDGKPVQIACMTCHTTRTPNPANARSEDLDLFHQGLQVAHGASLRPGGEGFAHGQPVATSEGTAFSCLTCHDATDYGRLHLANGTPVPFTEAMTLCAQCHGPQLRDYQHGAHGGMNGFWDLSAGGRIRNTCTSCHDPHAPRFQRMTPMPPPRDRFQTGGAPAHERGHP